MVLWGDCFEERESACFSTIFTWWHMGELHVYGDENSKIQKWALRMGSQGWHKFPKQTASVGTWRRGHVGILWVSLKKKGGITDNAQTGPMQGVLTLKRKSLFLWNPNELTRGLHSKHRPAPLPTNGILRCLSLNQKLMFFIVFFFLSE